MYDDLEMPKLVMALNLSGTLTRTISVSQPPYDYVDIFDKDWDVGFRQRFIWYPHHVTFLPPGDIGGYWTEIYTADALELQSDTAQAIVVPFSVPRSNQVYVSASDDRGTPFSLSHGHYQLLYESRYMTAAEAEKLDGFEYCSDLDEDSDLEEQCELASAEVIRFTFIRTEDLPSPRILRPERSDASQNLQLNPHIETAEKVSAYHAPPVHATSKMLDFIGVIEQTLREFYANDNLRCRPKSAAVLNEWNRTNETEVEMWIEVYGTPSTPNICLQEPHLWIRVDSKGELMFGTPVGGKFNTSAITGSCVWWLRHRRGNFSWYDAYSCGLKRYDAEALEELLLILIEKAREHFNTQKPPA